MFDNHVTVLIGESGSGKTAVAMQAAREQQRAGFRSTLIALRVVRPFDPALHGQVEEIPEVPSLQGIEKRTVNDPVSFITLLRELVRDGKRRIVVDVASDKATMQVLGQCLEAIPARLIDRLMVVNFTRPFTRTPSDALAVARELQATMGMPLTGILGNTHMMRETTAEMVLQGQLSAVTLSGQLGVPLVAVAVEQSNTGAVPRALSCPMLMLGSMEQSKTGKKQAGASAGGAACHRS